MIEFFPMLESESRPSLRELPYCPGNAVRQCVGTIICTLLVLVWGATSNGLAQTRTKTWQGIPLDEPFSISVSGIQLRIPAGYIWPDPAARHRITERPALTFQFWMPDRRWPEVAPYSYSGFQPPEAGRPTPPRGSYIVNVIFLRAVKLDDPQYVSPAKQFQNVVSLAGITSYSFEREAFGLIRFWQHNRPADQPEHVLDYRTIDGTDPLGLFWCTHPRLSTGHPNCQGEVYLMPEELAVRLQFPRNALSDWHAIVRSVRELVASWRQAAQTP
ncbi:hypothetical protein [Reyranella sp. CPCC 100927]|uniref:hypothetical protein n=1 Tax=Reyranella sp. CPCC 100927 TaxID=2599616 RepID=UPI0011B57B1C|nr:hypothetical protein [Reyranella sp. CPCC 100927]TWT13030.1 hypothetical protein FQU96_12390 [Reyranella sp. CPCC 100927]